MYLGYLFSWSKEAKLHSNCSLGEFKEVVHYTSRTAGPSACLSGGRHHPVKIADERAHPQAGFCCGRGPLLPWANWTARKNNSERTGSDLRNVLGEPFLQYPATLLPSGRRALGSNWRLLSWEQARPANIHILCPPVERQEAKVWTGTPGW